MGAEVRVLDEADREQITGLLARRPTLNLFVASRIAGLGISPRQLGCSLYGYERDGELLALCHAGSNLVPVEADADALRAFAATIGPRRNTQSIMGEASQVLALHELLLANWGGAWRRHREIRRHQPLLSIDTDPAIEPDERIARVRLHDVDPYFDAAVRMYTEEVGVSPLDATLSYRNYVFMLIEMGRAFGALDEQGVWFKSDIGAAHADICQVQGVWVTPRLRGRGLAPAAMAQVVRLAREQFNTVSLYVNDFNTRALRTYARVGFQQVGEMATVLY